ncbi:MAG: DUF488 domain-containing protein, partial [Deltaproteobacteria bacterium]|nr:DUF488 domain-containing protein [Deltaproteobacteria bacterium]
AKQKTYGPLFLDMIRDYCKPREIAEVFKGARKRPAALSAATDGKRHGIAYVFLGKELGPRSDDAECYEDGKVQYDRLSNTALFQEGLNRIGQGMASYRIALMCSEKDPVICHRTILVCRRLRNKDTRIRHILEDGSVEENDVTIRRLMNLLKLPESDLFTSPEEMVERAYDIQGDRIAYVQENEKGSQRNGRET